MATNTPTTQVTNGKVPSSTQGWLTKMKWMRCASYYPLEYILMLASSMGLILSTSLLAMLILNHWFDQAGLMLFTHSTALLLIATIVVVWPAHLIFYWRVRHTDRARVSTAALRVSHAALAVYVFKIVVELAFLTIWLVYIWLSVALGSHDYQTNLLVATLAIVHAMVWLKYSAWHFVRARTARARPRNYVVVVSLAALIVVVLGFVFLGLAGRSVARDTAKEIDLTTIEATIDSYASQHGRVPESLSMLSLTGDIKDHLSDYDYTVVSANSYQLCTTFQSSSSTNRPSFTNYDHHAGHQCFERTTYSSGDYLNSGSRTNNSLQQYLLDSGTQ